MINPYSLEGKTVLVTGASSGIGKGIAIECSKIGAKVVVTGRNQERLQQTYDLLEGEDHQMVIADLDKQEDIDNLVATIPAVDGLVLNAGMVIKSPVKFVTQDKLDQIFQTNVYAPMLLTQGLLKKKKLNKSFKVATNGRISSYLLPNFVTTVKAAVKLMVATPSFISTSAPFRRMSMVSQ